MIMIKNTQTLGWKHAIRGMRNPSWGMNCANLSLQNRTLN